MPPLRLTLPAVALTLLLQTPLPRSQAAVTLHVAPGGDDRWTGKLARPDPGGADGPLATLQGARDRVRGNPSRAPGPITVMIAPGTYPVTVPVVFEPADGGTASAPVVYQAEPGAHPAFDGGRCDHGVRSPARRALDRQGARGRGGPLDLRAALRERPPRPARRTPGQFYHYMLKRVDQAVDPATGKTAPMENRGVRRAGQRTSSPCGGSPPSSSATSTWWSSTRGRPRGTGSPRSITRPVS